MPGFSLRDVKPVISDILELHAGTCGDASLERMACGFWKGCLSSRLKKENRLSGRLQWIFWLHMIFVSRPFRCKTHTVECACFASSHLVMIAAGSSTHQVPACIDMGIIHNLFGRYL